MLSLFEEYKNAGKINEALLVGRNMVNKKPGDKELFNAYVELLLDLSEKLPSLDERKNFIGQANMTISFYEENVDLTTDVIDEIEKLRKRLKKLVINITQIEEEKSKSEYNKVVSNNTSQIKKIYGIKEKLMGATSQEVFDEILQEISLVDAQIAHDKLTDEQRVHYDQLNKECTECISEKMREIEHSKNVSYNKKAVEAFESAFKNFKANENKYKNQIQLFSLVSSTLFAYNATKLFNETLIYYNHVYSYIFNKLDDDGKLALTKFSIECERKLR